MARIQACVQQHENLPGLCDSESRCGLWSGARIFSYFGAALIVVIAITALLHSANAGGAADQTSQLTMPTGRQDAIADLLARLENEQQRTNAGEGPEPSRDTRSLPDVFAQGEASYAGGDLLGAERSFKTVINRQPEHELARQARHWLLEIYHRASADDKAASLVSDAQDNARDGKWQSTVKFARNDAGPENRVPAGPLAVKTIQPNLLANYVGDRVFFEASSVELTQSSLSVLKSQALWLQENAKYHVVIEGHSDDPGSLDDNYDLAVRRAEAVMTVLVTNGVSADRIKALAFGDSKPVALCDSRLCRDQNRRAITLARASQPDRRRLSSIE